MKKKIEIGHSVTAHKNADTWLCPKWGKHTAVPIRFDQHGTPVWAWQFRTTLGAWRKRDPYIKHHQAIKWGSWWVYWPRKMVYIMEWSRQNQPTISNHLQAGNQRKLGLNQQQLGNFMVTSYWFTVVDEVLVIDVAGR
jgi:hypothetical protein